MNSLKHASNRINKSEEQIDESEEQIDAECWTEILKGTLLETMFFT